MLLPPLLLTPLPACATMAVEGAPTDSGASAALQPDGPPRDRYSINRAKEPASSNEHAFITVRELMRIESEQALAAARQRRRQSAETSWPPPGGEGGAVRSNPTETLRLIGIYGVGKRLFAEVRSGSQAWLFLNGHSLPVGHTVGAGHYRLKKVAGACVHLEQQETETVLCLPRGGRQ